MPECEKCHNNVEQQDLSKSKTKWCKDCYREYHREYREKNREKLREYSSMRWDRDRDKLLQQTKEWRQNNHAERLEKEREYRRKTYDPAERREYRDKNREQIRENQRQYRLRNMEKVNARAKLNYHVKAGNIQVPESCEICEVEGKVESHHSDYTKPLDVVWLCDRCHKNVHKKLKISKLNKEKEV